MAKQNKTITASSWMYITGAGLILFVIILMAAGVFSRQLNSIQTPVYFFLLVVIGLIAAAFLFGAMRSYAKYNGKAAGGTLELGGPVVLLIIIIYLGYKFKPEEQKAFGITFNFFSADKDSAEISNGTVSLYYGAAVSRKQFSGGQAVFAEIPQQHSGTSATIIAEARDYETKKQQINLPSAGRAYNIYLQHTKDSVLMRGNIIGAKGKPLANATVIINDGLFETTTNAYGNFTLTLMLKDGAEVRVKVYKDDKLLYNALTIISSQTPVNIQL